MNTIEQNLERLATASERQAVALEAILEILGRPMPIIEVTGGEPAVNVVNTVEAQDEDTTAADPEPEVAEEPAAEEPAAEEAQEAGEAEDDPLGDGDGGAEELVAPKDLTTDVLRGKARELMDKEGKAAVFEVLAEVGKGYKAVGEVPKEELAEAWLKMAKRLQG
jgi:hypothetical protein